jgi:hypothetical protein
MPTVAPTSAFPAGASAGDDPFANMPRIRPFTDFALDPVDSVPPSVGPSAPAASTVPAAPVADQSPDALSAPGAPGAPDAPAVPRVAARHSTTPEPEPDASGGRRRRAAENGGHDVLAAILEREGAS